MFDLSKYDVATAADEGRAHHLLSPSGEPLYDEANKPVTVTLYGRHSERARKMDRKISDARMEMARRGKTKRTADDIEREQNEMLVSCTGGWSFTHLHGEEFPHSEANARKFWGDRRMANFREQAIQFINDDANFLKG